MNSSSNDCNRECEVCDGNSGWGGGGGGVNEGHVRWFQYFFQPSTPMILRRNKCAPAPKLPSQFIPVIWDRFYKTLASPVNDVEAKDDTEPGFCRIY